MLILDTNVVAELMRPYPAAAVARWLEAQPLTRLALTAVSLAEILYGLECLPEGRRRAELAGKFQAFLTRSFGEWVLPFDRRAAEAYAQLRSERTRAGRPLEGYDALIAAVARSRSASIVTRNKADFEACGVAVINPWSERA